MGAPLEQRHIDILARDVLDCRVPTSRRISASRLSASTLPPIETTTRLGFRSIVMG